MAAGQEGAAVAAVAMVGAAAGARTAGQHGRGGGDDGEPARRAGTIFITYLNVDGRANLRGGRRRCVAASAYHRDMARDAVAEIKARLDIVDVVGGYVTLQRAGRGHRALCPFHSEKTPSFNVSQDKQAWYCFGCQEGGDMFTFVQKVEHTDFRAALEMLADKAGVELEAEAQGGGERRGAARRRKRTLELNARAAAFFEHVLWASPAGEDGRALLAARGVDEVAGAHLRHRLRARRAAAARTRSPATSRSVPAPPRTRSPMPGWRTTLVAAGCAIGSATGSSFPSATSAARSSRSARARSATTCPSTSTRPRRPCTTRGVRSSASTSLASPCTSAGWL